jgi:hypothetical protein
MGFVRDGNTSLGNGEEKDCTIPYSIGLLQGIAMDAVAAANEPIARATEACSRGASRRRHGRVGWGWAPQ